MTPQRLWARCIAGLERVAVQEIISRCHPSTLELRLRGVLFGIDDVAPALDLRTVDDVYIGGVAAEGIGRTKASLRGLKAAVRAADPLGLTRIHRPPASPPLAIEVTASFTGRRTYNRFDIEDEVGSELSRILGVPYVSRRDGPPPTDRILAWRVHLDPDVTLIGLRLASRPLHRRAYKESSIPGTLHPPMAAALVLLAQPTASTLVVDPTCGAGTILVEAKQLQPDALVVGIDISTRALDAASANVALARVHATLLRSDAARLPLADSVAATIITNPPWGRQAAAGGGLTSGLDALWAEAARVLAPGGSLITLTEESAPGPTDRSLAVSSRLRVSLRGTRSLVTTHKRE